MDSNKHETKTKTKKTIDFAGQAVKNWSRLVGRKCSIVNAAVLSNVTSNVSSNVISNVMTVLSNVMTVTNTAISWFVNALPFACSSVAPFTYVWDTKGTVNNARRD